MSRKSPSRLIPHQFKPTFTSNASYLSSAKATLFDSPSDNAIEDYFDKYDEEVQEKRLQAQNAAASHQQTSAETFSHPRTLQNAFNSTSNASFSPSMKFLIFQYLSTDLLRIFGTHGVSQASFIVLYRDAFPSLSTSLGLSHQHFLKSPIVRQLPFDPHFIQRDQKKYQKLWFRDLFGLQYYSLYECAFRWMLHHQHISLPKTTRAMSTPQDHEGFHLLQSLLRLREANVGVLMCHGGYFAGGFWKNSHCHTHKTFHSYVVRKKQGKRQATRDKSQRGRSVGAEMRRQNESHFRETLIRVLTDWKPLFDECDMLLISAPGPINRSYMFGEDSPLHEDDPRIFSPPFHIEGNPNFQKIIEVYDKLTKVSTLYATNAPNTLGEMSLLELRRMLEAMERPDDEDEDENFSGDL